MRMSERQEMWYGIFERLKLTFLFICIVVMTVLVGCASWLPVSLGTTLMYYSMAVGWLSGISGVISDAIKDV